MSRKTASPLSAQQPANPFLNDGVGFWQAVQGANGTSGLQTLLDPSTAFRVDVQTASRVTTAQVAWLPVQARWRGTLLTVSLSDSQFLLALEEGGDTQQGRITVVVDKLQLRPKFPSYNETFEIQANGQWHQFTIAEIIGLNDDNETTLTLFLEKDQNDIGN